VDYGIAMFVTDESVGPHELGWLVEQHGFESLFVPAHTHMPVERTVTMFMNEADPDVFAGLEHAGVSRIVTWIEPCGKEDAERALEQIATACGVIAPAENARARNVRVRPVNGRRTRAFSIRRSRVGG
jgi:hypothetical protein